MIAEAGVLGELAVGDRDHPVIGAHPVHRVHRDSARLEISRADDNSVDGGAEPGEFGGQHVGLEREVAPQGGVAAAQEHIRHVAFQASRLGKRPHDLRIAFRRIGFRETAGVGEHEEARGGLLKSPSQVIHRPLGEYRQVGDGLGAGGVVVEHYQATAGTDLVEVRTYVTDRRLTSQQCL